MPDRRSRPRLVVLVRALPFQILLVVFVATSAGCRHRPSSQEAAPATPAAAPAVASLDDPCTLLSDDDVAEVLRMPQVRRERTGAGARSGKICSISASDRSRQNGLGFSIGYGTDEDFQQMRGSASATAESVPGVGEQAFWSDSLSTAAALVNGRAVIVTGPDDRASAVALLKRALARLPAGR
jgi:Protein of unknown function (DUF3558)